MSREQIKEMEAVIESIESNAYTLDWGADARADLEKIAEILYNAGYRKQSDVIRCKDCERFYQVGDVRICRHWNYHSTKDDAYCSFAKMKGGAE